MESSRQVQPAALQAALDAAEAGDSAAQAARVQWQHRLEQARYQAQLPAQRTLRAHQIAGPDARFPVRGLLWLSQAETLGVEPMSPGEATARLLACCPVVNTDPYRLDRVLSVILERAVTPCLT